MSITSRFLKSCTCITSNTYTFFQKDKNIKKHSQLEKQINIMEDLFYSHNSTSKDEMLRHKLCKNYKGLFWGKQKKTWVNRKNPLVLLIYINSHQMIFYMQEYLN